MNKNCHRTKSFCSVTLSYRSELATDFGFTGSLFFQVQSGPPSLKTQCHKKSDCQPIFPKMQHTYSLIAKLGFVKPLIFQIPDSSP